MKFQAVLAVTFAALVAAVPTPADVNTSVLQGQENSGLAKGGDGPVHHGHDLTTRAAGDSHKRKKKKGKNRKKGRNRKNGKGGKGGKGGSGGGNDGAGDKGGAGGKGGNGGGNCHAEK
ncbi:hypothetical protein NLG97_g1474 [Lecanicillium saksenae]|uniref:Uncharacterized protein n=1 Tax=Lecanicillium saksenae TaxID=468837 RepID=A0ACC1R699_9HYPO|nr:hypothetical protein NLG97_g1474 [Lecanicillium saksenae]